MVKKQKFKKPEPKKVIYAASDIKDYLSDKFEMECDVFWELFFKNSFGLESFSTLYINDVSLSQNFETKEYFHLIFKEFGEDDNDLIIERDI